MPAAVHVLCGPAGSGKTQRLLQRYRSVAGTSPGAALWLAPTRRAVEAVRLSLARVDEGCLALNLFTFQDFAEEVVRVNDPAARPVSNVQRRLLVEDIVAELHGRGKLAHFQGVIDTRGFGDSVFELLAELKRSEIWPEEFSEAVARRSDPKKAESKDRQCAVLYSAYQERLIRHNLYDLEGRVWYARDLLGRGVRRPFERVRAVFVDGFTDFTVTQREILDALAQAVQELWITLPDERGEERAELFGRPRATLERLKRLQSQAEVLMPKDTDTLPPGLAHLERELFRPLRAVRRSADADGLLRIEAPGMVGETRMVARQVKRLLLDGVAPDEILVTMRDVLPYADLVREIFSEYGIPADIEGTEPLQRNPAIATLVRAIRLPDEDWPFAQVTALLRSGYFRPDWPSTRLCPDIAQHGEALLRLLGEPRGRDTYLRAVDRWAERALPGLEDEQAEASRRQRIHELAKKCRDFLHQFFRAWDEAPPRRPLGEHVAWLCRLADELGITRTAAESDKDRAALARFWEELRRWQDVAQRIHPKERLPDRGQFFRLITVLAAEAGMARTPRGEGRVRVLSAALARGLKADHVFVMGLGERSFPRLEAPEPLFDEQERQALRQAGLDFPCVADRMPEEMLLFYQVVTAARRRLVLSYPAVDEKGQAQLPSSFLARLCECFTPQSIPVERRRMLVEGYDRDAPLSEAEYRVRLACALAGGGHGASPLTADPSSPKGEGRRSAMLANLLDAADLARLRFHAHDFSPYDGMLRDPAVIAEVAKGFGPERILSPTALENYIACPFKFFLGNVLRLELLEEPTEEIESTDRGLAFHRALSRLHRQLRQLGIHQPALEVGQELMARLDEAVNECAVRASPAGEVLWKLEGERLKRLAARYRPHWEKFLQPWLPRGVRPRPELFEVGFGMPGLDGEEMAGPLVIVSEEVEVRISGRIDRVDVAELPGGAVGFWVIDYKTGRAAHYTGSDLKEFKRLQLTLYALAVEQVLLADRSARPMGLAYWLVTDTGPKVALPAHPRHLAWFDETAAWQKVREQLQRWVVTLVSRIRQGEFPLKPRSEVCTDTCDFGQVCRISQSRSVVGNKTWHLPLPTTS